MRNEVDSDEEVTETKALIDMSNQAALFAFRALKTEASRADPVLMRDMVSIFEGNAIYIPGFYCKEHDMSAYQRLKRELEEYAESVDGSGLVEWSKHSKHENPEFSATFNAVVAKIAEYFDLEVYQTRLNYYKDGQDWKPFHHDSHAFGNKEEDFTAGVSFGSRRELQFLHPRSGALFGFPQNNGDVFAFTKDVNRRFMHGVPRDRKGSGPRISIIVWGKRKSFNGRNGTARADAEVPISSDDRYVK